MLGAQGSQQPGSRTATTYDSVPQENPPKTNIHSSEDDRGIQVDKLEDKVEDAAGKGGFVFGAAARKDENKEKQDMDVTG